MIQISIDTTEVTQALNLTQEKSLQLADSIVKGLALGLYEKWIQLAKRELGSTREDYINSLVIGDDGFLTSKVTLTGEMNNMIEQGSAPFDQKEGFSKSSKRKTKADGGWYLTVPFRHAVPGSVGESSHFSSVMPETLYERLIEEYHETGEEKLTVKEKNLPKELQTKGVRKELTVPKTNRVFEAYKHKSAQYAGITKITKTYNNATQSQYMTFRRVSDKSDPNSWIHPGFNAFKLGEKALGEMDVNSMIAKMKDKFIDEL